MRHFFSIIFLLLSAGFTQAQSLNMGVGTSNPGSKLTVVGSMAVGHTSTSSNAYAILDDDYYIIWTGTASGTATLPAAAAIKKGRTYKIKNNTVSFSLTIGVTGGVTIDGASTVTVPPGNSIELIANGNISATAWEVVSAVTSSSTASTNSASSGTIAGAGGACTPTPTASGTLVQTAPATTQSVTVTVTVTKPGNYSIATNTVNGLHFEGTGYFAAIGTQTVQLFAKGTPTTAGTAAFTFAYGTSTCTFSVNVTSFFSCGSATLAQSPSGALTATTYTGGYTIPYPAGNGLSYPATSQTINGLTFARTAGTYAPAGGNVVYTLSGTYTGSNTTETFTTPECGSVVFGDAIRGALASVSGCTSCAAYDAAAVNSWVPVTAAEYAAVANTSNITSAAKGGAPDADMTATGNAFSGGYTVGGSTAYTTIPASSYLIGFRMVEGVGAQSRPGAKVKVGTSATSGYAAINNTIGTYTTPAAFSTSYFVAKRPTAQTAASAGYLGMYNGSNSSAYTSFVSGGNGGYGSGDVGIVNTSIYEMQIQCISTTIKQW